MRRVLIALLVLSTSATPARADWCGEPLRAVDDSEPGTPVTLSGRVVQRWAWGPPNFGEDPKHDMRWRATFLRLDRRTKVEIERFADEADQPSVLAIDIIQLSGIFMTDRTLPSRYLGYHVVVTGALWRASAPSEVADVIVHVKAVRNSSRSVCGSQIDAPR